MPQWTEEQKKVIDSDRKIIYCSAAAGSGKTTVMIERIVRLIREGADPYSFLVITFTNAAAAEMKERIRKRLLSERENPVIAAAAEKTGSMEICTIHAFCQRLIRQEFQVVRVDPMFQICTGAYWDQLFHDAFRRTCNELNQKKDEDYALFTREYEPEAAEKIVRAVWHYVMSLPDPFVWLKEKVENIPVHAEQDHPWFRIVRLMLKEKEQKLRIILRRQADLFEEYEKQEAYRAVFTDDLRKAEELFRWADGEDITPEVISSGLCRLPPLKNLNDRETDWRDRYQALRKKEKEIISQIQAWMAADREQMKKEFARIQSSLRGLEKLTTGTHEAFEENKKKACVLDFSDLEHKALAILQDENCIKSVQGRYARIFVDECQDISSVQDKLIQTLTGEQQTLFMVGDVKQSIYRFRLANPGLFNGRLKTPDSETKKLFFLQSNFRSRPEILETANVVFRDIMHQEVADVDYTPSDELVPGRTDCPGAEPVVIDLLEVGEGRTRLEAVAEHTAGRIRELVASGRFQYRDIVILMPEVSTDGPKLSELLKKENIPVFFDGKGMYFDQPEVQLFRNLLTLLDNPHHDLALLSVLSDFPFQFTEEELAGIRLSQHDRKIPFSGVFESMASDPSEMGKKCLDAKMLLDRWRFHAARMQLDEFLWYLMEQTEVSAVFGAGSRGRTAQKNLRNLCVQADRARDRGISGLHDFLDFLSEQASGGEMRAATALADGDQVVRLMTVHKSKGLQFPVVFCLGMDKGLKGKPDGTVQLDEELGISLRYKIPKWRLSRKTAADEIFEWKKNHDVRAEKIALLYVAMTRASERLYLVGTEQDRPLWHLPPGGHRVVNAEDFLDCLMPSLLDAEKKSTSFTQASKPWKITKVDNNQQKIVENKKIIHNLAPWAETLHSARPVDELWKNKETENNPSGEDRLLRKQSVTSLLEQTRRKFFPEEEEQTPEEKRTPDYVERLMKRYQASRRPVFAPLPEKMDGAARGTVIHRFLSLADLDLIRRGEGGDRQLLSDLKDRLVRDGVFTETEAACIQPESISRFLVSDIGQRMLASPEIHREWNFNLYVRERGIILQGMIDCAFLEGQEWVLLDYKTDRIRDEAAFVEEYRPQLLWYAEALRILTGKTVKESWLYALSVDKAYRIDA